MIKALAKLRQFRSGMNAESYMITELRQNWLAIERAFKSIGVKITDATEDDGISEISPGELVFSAVKNTSLSSGPIPMTKDIDAFIINDGGTWSGYNFSPKDNGLYSVEIGYLGSVVPDPGGTVTATVVQIVKNSIVENSASYSLKIQSGATSVSGAGAATAKAFVDLTTTDTVRFTYVPIASGGSVSANNFYCEIKKLKGTGV